jgi:ketosteroid isomerase-like protein
MQAQTMHPHEKIIREFYAAFAARDAAGMARCYHADITFTDPAFPMLVGNEAGAMWAMLTSRAGEDFEVILGDVSADDAGGQAHWEAKYTFSQSGRKVHNKIDALFAFRDGKIVRHIDRFSFWRWSAQALGPIGAVFGWAWPIQKMVRGKAKKSLVAFMETYTSKI